MAQQRSKDLDSLRRQPDRRRDAFVLTLPSLNVPSASQTNAKHT
jgi:hypothetical protein